MFLYMGRHTTLGYDNIGQPIYQLLYVFFYFSFHFR